MNALKHKQHHETASKTFLLICKGVEIHLSTKRGPKHFFTDSQWQQVHRIMVEDMLHKCIQIKSGKYLLNRVKSGKIDKYSPNTTCFHDIRSNQSPHWGRHNSKAFTS